MDLTNYREVQEWKREGKDFMVVVNHWYIKRTNDYSYRDCKEHKWAVYVYLYPKHSSFVTYRDAGCMQECNRGEPWHSYCSFYRHHIDWKTNQVTSVQIGCDFGHHGDNHEQDATPDDVWWQFKVADRLFKHFKGEDYD